MKHVTVTFSFNFLELAGFVGMECEKNKCPVFQKPPNIGINRTYVYLAYLNATKVFDCVNHFQRYQTLMKRHVPTPFLNDVINWHSKLTAMMIRWNTALSDILIEFVVVYVKVGYSHPVYLMSMLICSLITC